MNGPMVGLGELRAASQQRLAEIENELRESQSLADRHGAERRKLELARRRALDAAATAALAGLDDASLARAVKLTGFTPLIHDNPRAGVETERRRLEARIAEIEADPRWRDRELLRAPRVGTLVRQIEELEEFRASLAEVVARAAHPRLERLLETGYGSDAYTVGWWRASYYADWKAGDEILEKFPTAKSFAEAREEILRARESLAVYDSRLAALRTEHDDGVAIEKEREAKVAALAGLEQTFLGEWRNRLSDHLASLDPAVLGDRLAGEPDLELLVKQGVGLERKIAYLDQLVSEKLAPVRKALVDERSQLQRELVKYARPKYAQTTMPRDRFERRFRDRPAKLRKGITRVTHEYHTIHHFDSWDRARLVDDFLWWDLMTDTHYSHDDESAAAAAAIAHDTTPDTLLDAS